MSRKMKFLSNEYFKSHSFEEVKAEIIRRYPEAKDWQWWDEFGVPLPDPAELARGTPAPDIDADLNSPDEDDDEE